MPHLRNNHSRPPCSGPAPHHSSAPPSSLTINSARKSWNASIDACSDLRHERSSKNCQARSLEAALGSLICNTSLFSGNWGWGRARQHDLLYIVASTQLVAQSQSKHSNRDGLRRTRLGIDFCHEDRRLSAILQNVQSGRLHPKSVNLWIRPPEMCAGCRRMTLAVYLGKTPSQW